MHGSERSVLSIIASIPTNFSSKTKYDGFTFGIIGAAPIGGGFSLYGNGVLGFLDEEFEPAGAHDTNAIYEAAELGIAFKPQSAPLSFSVGYKVQIIDNKTDDPNFSDQNVIDLTRGFILGLNLIF